MKTLAELQAIRDKIKEQIINREMPDNNDIKVVVGMATCGIAAGAREVINSASEEIESKKLSNVKLSQTGCMGICAFEPIVEVYVPQKEKITYVHMTADKMRSVVTSHILNGKVIEEYTYNYAVKNREDNK